MRTLCSWSMTTAMAIGVMRRNTGAGWTPALLSSKLVQHPAWRAHGVVPVIDVHDLGGDAVGHVGEQKGADAADVLVGHRLPRGRHGRIQGLHALGSDGRAGQRFERAGAERIDPHSLRPEV